ncbi:Teneurin-2 [Xenoophorus captivus]|uniref:Teneurin-2 n=1 Tax=Xenoophorus captivus TaxID=1517983 RepID=A0ABV0RKU0_9TELE
MDLKDRRNRSLTRSRCSKDSQYNTSSLDTDERRVPTQKSYSSSETLKAFDHEQRLHYGGCVTDLVHHEADEYSRQAYRFHRKPRATDASWEVWPQETNSVAAPYGL